MNRKKSPHKDSKSKKLSFSTTTSPQAKFPSSKLEMNAVADKFDHGDGMIDWREFMAALRPDWEERGPLTDTQRIDDEIKRQVAQCTCRQKFKVFQVGEGKYRVRERGSCPLRL
jgi:hypothetical protein